MKTLDYLDSANQKAIKADAMEEAKIHFDQAMELLDTLPDIEENRERRISMLVNQDNVFLTLLQMSEYHQLLLRYESVATDLGNQGLAGAFLARLAYSEFAFGNFDQGISLSTRAANLCKAAGCDLEAAHAYMVQELCCVYKGELETTLILKELVLQNMTNRFDLTVYVRALIGSLWALALLGRWDEAIRQGQDALKAARDYSDRSLIAFSAFALVVPYGMRGELDKAVEYGKLAVKEAPTPMDKAVAQSYLSWAWSRIGDPEKGIEFLEPYFQMAQSGRHMFVVLPTGYCLCDAYLLAGKYNEAQRTTEEYLKTSTSCKARWFEGCARRFLAEAAFGKGNLGEAEEHLTQCIPILTEIKAENELALAYSGMGRYHKQQGNTEQAREYLTKALEIFERLGTLIEPDKVSRELGELA